jgi:hypothetical protein
MNCISIGGNYAPIPEYKIRRDTAVFYVNELHTPLWSVFLAGGLGSFRGYILYPPPPLKNRDPRQGDLFPRLDNTDKDVIRL